MCYNLVGCVYWKLLSDYKETGYDGLDVAVPVPVPLYQRIEQLAKVTRRSVPETLASALTAALAAPGLPQTLADELAGLHWLSDAGLRKAIQPTFSKTQQERLGG